MSKTYNQAELIQSIEKTLKISLEYAKIKETGNNASDAFANIKISEVFGVSSENAMLLKILDKIGEIKTYMAKDSKVKEGKLEETIIDIIVSFATLKALIDSKKV